MQGLELVPDLLLGPAVDLPPDPPSVGPEAERDRADVPVLRRREVDRVLAVPSALRPGGHHGRSVTGLAPRLAPRACTKIGNYASELVVRGGVEPPTFRFSGLRVTVQDRPRRSLWLLRDVGYTLMDAGVRECMRLQMRLSRSVPGDPGAAMAWRNWLVHRPPKPALTRRTDPTRSQPGSVRSATAWTCRSVHPHHGGACLPGGGVVVLVAVMRRGATVAFCHLVRPFPDSRGPHRGVPGIHV